VGAFRSATHLGIMFLAAAAAIDNHWVTKRLAHFIQLVQEPAHKDALIAAWAG
jgi:hypothetical protein